MQYDKPHLTYEEQVSLLENRGLAVGDFAAAIRMLKRVGYYRLSAYTYVLRAPIAAASNELPTKRSTSFVAGARFEDAVALCDFDSRLRTVVLAGLQQLELGLRVRIGHRLGKVNSQAHALPQYLDPTAARAPSRDNPSVTAHEAWVSKYGELLHEARNEEFVKHFLLKYDGQLPIWAATEIMTFGCLTALYSLMGQKEANEVAAELGAGNRDMLHAWMKALNVLRNNCAHNARTWNRTTIYPPAKPPDRLVPARLHHLRQSDNNKLYFLAALAAHLLRNIDAQTQWPSQFVTIMRKFPDVNGMTPQSAMGFPEGWDSLELWVRN